MQRSTIGEAEQFIREQLADGPKLFGDLIASSGISARTLSRAGKNLGVHHTRDGRRGPWIWSLDKSVYLFAPPVDGPGKEPAEPPAQISEAVPVSVSPDIVPDVNELLALAVAGGLHYPLYVASHSIDGKWWSQIYRAPGADPECDYGTPMPPPYAMIVVHEWDELIRRQRDRTLRLEDGRLSWRDWRWRPPCPVKKGE